MLKHLCVTAVLQWEFRKLMKFKELPLKSVDTMERVKEVCYLGELLS